MRRRFALTGAMAVIVLGSVPAVSQATFIPGPNGKIVFTSGRASAEVPAPADGNDDKARLWVADYPNGTPTQVTFSASAVQHRHPSWSPDHTRIVYASGAAFAGPYELRIKDLVTGSDTLFAAAAAKQDRPSWSPDGTRIAYGSLGDLWVKGVAAGSTAVNLTETPAIDEERPVWSPDGNTLYYNRGAAGSRDIYSFSPVTPAGESAPVATGVGDDWQPALSPDGTRLCFLRGEQNSNSDLYTVPVDGSIGAAEFAKTEGVGELNCVWSPDGSMILYTRGAFSAGELYTRSPNGSNIDELGQYNVEKHFDGNADWATNFSAQCAAVNAVIGVNQFTTVQLSCTDPDFGPGASPPGPVGLESGEIEIVAPPKHGAIGGITDDARVIYTPNKDFTGADTFTYRGTDGVSDGPPATVTIQVTGPSAPPVDRTAPRISGIAISQRRWRLGNQLAKISAAPIGTTISFRLSEPAQSTVTFQRRKRRKGGKPKYVNAGKVVKQAKAGKNRLRFQGLITRRKKLTPGTYRVVVSARDAAGNRSKRNGPTFTIVRK